MRRARASAAIERTGSHSERTEEDPPVDWAVPRSCRASSNGTSTSVRRASISSATTRREGRCHTLPDLCPRQLKDHPVISRHLENEKILSLLGCRHHDVAEIEDVLRLRRTGTTAYAVPGASNAPALLAATVSTGAATT